jgi:hypothetical protein
MGLIRYIIDKLKSKKLYDIPIGQINRGTELGEFIYTLVKERADINTIVESGTWNGLGTTRCVLEGLQPHHQFWSIELYPEMHDIARKNNAQYLHDSRVNLLLGSLVSEKDTHWFDHKELKSNPNKHARLWYEKDMKLLRNSKNVLDKLPSQIDLLILDGGEYSTYPEWVKLKDRTKIVVLDDICVLKCAKIDEELIQNEHYTCIIRNTNERHGFSVYEKNIPGEV